MLILKLKQFLPKGMKFVSGADVVVTSLAPLRHPLPDSYECFKLQKVNPMSL